MGRARYEVPPVIPSTLPLNADITEGGQVLHSLISAAQLRRMSQVQPPKIDMAAFYAAARKRLSDRVMKLSEYEREEIEKLYRDGMQAT